jgi:hypothetical protein
LRSSKEELTKANDEIRSLQQDKIKLSEELQLSNDQKQAMQALLDLQTRKLKQENRILEKFMTIEMLSPQAIID